MATPDPLTLRARNASLLVFSIFGFLFSTWLSRIPSIVRHLGLTPGEFGNALLAASLGGFVGLVASGRVAHRLGSTVTVRTGSLIAGVGLVTIGAADSVYVLQVGLLLWSFGFGLWNVAQNLQAALVEQTLMKPIMSWFHAICSAGNIVGVGLGALLVWLHFPTFSHFLVSSLLVLLAVGWSTRHFLTTRTPETTNTTTPGEVARPAWFEVRTLLIGVLLLTVSFAEGTADNWLSLALIDGHGFPTVAGVVGLAVFLVANTVARLVGPTLITRYGRVSALRMFSLITIAGVLFVVFGSLPLVVVGVVLWGAGVSLGSPITLSAAAEDMSRAAARLSVVYTVSYLSRFLGPVLMGGAGDRFGTLHALLMVAAVSVGSLLLAGSVRSGWVPSRSRDRVTA